MSSECGQGSAEASEAAEASLFSHTVTLTISKEGGVRARPVQCYRRVLETEIPAFFLLLVG